MKPLRSLRRTAALRCALWLAGATLLAAGCRAPAGGPGPMALAQPGWGRSFAPPEEHMTVRAVPASTRSRLPAARLFRPGWGWSAGR